VDADGNKKYEAWTVLKHKEDKVQPRADTEWASATPAVGFRAGQVDDDRPRPQAGRGGRQRQQGLARARAHRLCRAVSGRVVSTPADCFVLGTEDGRVIFMDLGSSHGSKVNGKTVSGRVCLAIGDIIKVGKTKILFTVIPEGADEPLR